MVSIGEKVLYKNQVATILSIKEEWTSWPHGSGTDYNIYIIQLQNGEKIECNDLNGEKFISKYELENKIRYLEREIKFAHEQIIEHKNLIEKLK